MWQVCTKAKSSKKNSCQKKGSDEEFIQTLFKGRWLTGYVMESQYVGTPKSQTSIVKCFSCCFLIAVRANN
jgi:hypothetical protein